LKAGANPNTATPSGETPLMNAARAGSTHVVKALLARGAQVNATEKVRGQTALMWAAANRHAPVVKALLEGGADVTIRTVTRPVRFVVGADHAEFLPDGGSTALFFAARSGDKATGNVLLQGGASVNDTLPDGSTALTFAAHSGRGDFARMLLDNGANPNIEGPGYTALHAAVLRADLALVKALLARGADANARLSKGTPVNRDSKDYYFNTKWIGATPFWLAAKFAEVEIMRVLLAGGADPRTPLPDGTTPLMAAAGVDNERLDRRERRRDPIEYEALASSLEGIAFRGAEAVLQAGADIDAVNNDGNTAVHHAAINKKPSVVELLAKHGAKLEVKNKRGQTPLGIANLKTRMQSEEAAIDSVMVDLLHRLGATQ
jgi:ankyrin repeat protein